MQQAKEDIGVRMNNLEEDSLVRIESLQEVTQEDLIWVQTRFGERCEDLDAAVNNVRGQVIHNKEKIEEIQQQELINI